MYKNIKDKIISLINIVVNFVQKNLVQVIIVSGVFIFLQLIKNLPYINIIPNYEFLVLGFTLLLIVLLFKIFISNRKIIIIVLSLFVFGALATIFEMDKIADLIGFVIYILLAIFVLVSVISERKILKKEMRERK